MIGKPDWFKRRKYLGWGVFPITWQGWVYVVAMLVPFAIFQALPFWSIKTRTIATAIWVLIILVDVTDIMLRMKKDEREAMHEAISERNALWAIIAVLVIGVLYQLVTSTINQKPAIDPIIAIALGVGLAAKAISNIYLDRKD